MTAQQRFRQIRDYLLRIVFKATWPWMIGSLAALYLFGVILMPMFEGPDRPLARLPDYTWWFIVTATTVGYGDIAPETFGGRAVAVVIMLFGIGVIAVTVAKLAESVIDFGRRSMRGLSQLHEEGHLVILGYNPGETETLVRELLHDESEDQRSIVLCSDAVEENPLPEQVKFVRGPLSSDDVLQRACVAAASRILVHGRDDDQTLVAALAAHSANPSAHIVALVRQAESEVHLKRIHPEIECVMPLAVPLMVQSIQDRGATNVISSLLSNATDATIYRLDIPSIGMSWPFGALQRAFKEKLGATLVAVGPGGDASQINLNPDNDHPVNGGCCLFYIAPRRLSGNAVPWDDL